MQEASPMCIFISYGRTDLPFVRRLAQDLQQALGSEQAVWYDVHNLKGGDTWWHQIQIELRRATIFLIVCTPAAMKSRWVDDEINIAWQRKNSSAQLRIIPLLCEPCELRDDLQTLQMIDFHSPTSYQDALQKLLNVLGLQAAQRSPWSSTPMEEQEDLETSLPTSAQPGAMAALSSSVPDALHSQVAGQAPVSSAPSQRRILTALLGVLLLVGGGGLLYYTGYYLPAQQHAVATATARSVDTVAARNNAILTTGLVANNPYPPHTGTLQLKDTLQQNTGKQDWDTGISPHLGSCLFIEGAYHAAVMQAEHFYYCS